MNEAIAINTSDLTKIFGDNIAVDNLDLEIKKGELFGLVGPDGAGETTTMRLLTAIMEPTSGEAWVAGHSILNEGERIKEKIGYMSQRFGLYEDLTVFENIVFYADLYEVPMKERPARIDRLLGFSNLTPFKGRLAGRLSGGMKQKLGLACALIHTPEVLFLDEPIALGYITAISELYSQRIKGGRITPLIDPRVRVWYNPELKSRNYIIPGLIAVIMAVIAALLTSLTIAREWERGTMEQLISTPVKTPELIIGKLLPYFFIGFVDVALSVIMAVFVFEVPLRGNIFLLDFSQRFSSQDLCML